MDGMGASQDHDSRLADMLRRYRSRRSAELEVKPFRVFHESTLEELVEQKPRHPKQLEEIPRFGDMTIGAHGAGVLRVIDEWADRRWKDPLDLEGMEEDVSVFEDTLGDSSWTKVLTQLYLSFSRGRPRVTSKELVLRSGCSEETVRRVLVRMDEKGIIDRGGRGEGHMLDPGKKRGKDLIYALERIEGRGKSDEIGHFIEHLRVIGMVDRTSAIDDGILELLDGDPVGMHGFLEDPVDAIVWAENSLRNVLEFSADGVVHYRYELSNGARTDAAIRMPDGSMLCIDAKLPIGEFRNLAEDPSKRKSFLGSLRYKIRTTGEKYAVPDAGTAPFCILYIPSEEMLSKISELDSGILNFALEHNVFIASPTSLAVILFSVDATERIPSQIDKMWINLRHLKEQEEFNFKEMYGKKKGFLYLYDTSALKKNYFGSNSWYWPSWSEFGEPHIRKGPHRGARVSVRTQDSERKIVRAIIEELDWGPDIEREEKTWILRSDLFEKADLECSNSRFSQILGGMEERGFIERRYGSDAGGVRVVSVALRAGAQGLTSLSEEERAKIAGLFDDSGNPLLPS